MSGLFYSGVRSKRKMESAKYGAAYSHKACWNLPPLSTAENARDDMIVGAHSQSDDLISLALVWDKN